MAGKVIFKEEILTHEILLDVIEYDQNTGSVIWSDTPRNRRSRDRFCLKEAGSLHRSTGYRHLTLSSVRYRMHRVIWFYVTGAWPEGVIDHINGIKNDNRWVNLRDVNPEDNTRNAKLRVDSSSGITGVSWDKREVKWMAYINANKVRITLGYSVDFFEACCTRKSAELKCGYHENHGRVVLN